MTADVRPSDVAMAVFFRGVVTGSVRAGSCSTTSSRRSATPSPGGSDLYDRLEYELVRNRGPAARLLSYGLVDRHDPGRLDVRRLAGDLLVTETSPSRTSRQRR